MSQIISPVAQGSAVGTISTIADVQSNASFVEWGAVWAGGALAAALSFVFLAFAAATGLSFVSPWQGSWAPVTAVASFALFFVMAQQIGAAMAGGYVAGRMRSRWGEATAHEVEFRDGLHGGLVWAVSVIMTAILLFSVAGAVGKSGASVAAVAAASANPLDYSVDILLRPAGSGPTPSSASSAGSNGTPFADTRAAVVRTLGNAVLQGKLDENDRTYLALVVARQSGLPQADAEKRVSDVFDAAVRIAKEAADKVRRASILMGFVTAASLLIAFGAAWWAAQRGGHHRDNAIPARFTNSSRRMT